MKLSEYVQIGDEAARLAFGDAVLIEKPAQPIRFTTTAAKLEEELKDPRPRMVFPYDLGLIVHLEAKFD